MWGYLIFHVETKNKRRGRKGEWAMHDSIEGLKVKNIERRMPICRKRVTERTIDSIRPIDSH